MENIRQAVERAKAGAQQQGDVRTEPPRLQAKHLGDTFANDRRANEVQLDVAHLQSRRIVAFDGRDALSRPFDMLRTEVLQSMDQKGWKTLAVTSPTPSCGKTLTALNLALSIARQPEREVFLADLDFRRPRVADSLGIKCKDGVAGIIEGRIEMDSAIIQAKIGGSRLQVLPTAPASNPSDLVASSAMREMLEDIAGRAASGIVILDLPPVLTGHDVISILPLVDCVLFVAAVGTSKISEIEQSKKYLSESNVVRFVLNKAPVSTTNYGYY
jgi:protein-tyrosine kinase